MCEQLGGHCSSMFLLQGGRERATGGEKQEKKGVFWLFTSSYFSGERRARNVKIFRLFSSCFFGYFLLEIWNNLDCVEFFSLEKLI